MDIEDKVVIITGASDGIGLAAARHLSRLGANVVISARSKDKLNALSKQIPKSFVVVADMRKPEDIRALVQKTMEKYGRIDILINNAGQGMYGPLESIDIEQYRRMMDLNVYGVLIAMQLVIPIMRRQGGGMILNVSSGVTKMYIPHLSAYSSTKYALNALSLIARQELEKDNIIVSLIEPNMTATSFAKNAIGSRPDFAASGRPMPQIDTAEKVADYIAQIIRSEEAEVRVR